MKITALSLAGAYLITSEPVHDERGYFARTFCKTTFLSHGLDSEFPQHSVSYNQLKATLRGLHYQSSPHQEIKLVRCTRGSIYDVMVDLREDSPTYGQWLGFELTADNNTTVYIPQGFAHGFITLEHATEVYYQISQEYAPGHDRTIRWDDPELKISWPLAPEVISHKDRQASAFFKFESGKKR